MKLKLIESGHWQVARQPYPNKIIKTKQAKRPLSFFIDPDEPKKFFGGKLFETEILDIEQAHEKIRKGEDLENTDIDIKKDQELKKQKEDYKNKVLAPKLKDLQTNIYNISNELDKKKTEANKNINDAGELGDRVNDMTKDIKDLLKNF